MDKGNPPGCMRLKEYGTCEVAPSIEQEISGLIPGLPYQTTDECRPFVERGRHESIKPIKPLILIDKKYVWSYD